MEGIVPLRAGDRLAIMAKELQIGCQSISRCLKFAAISR